MQYVEQARLLVESMHRMKNVHYWDIVPDLTKSEIFLISAISMNEASGKKVSDLCEGICMHPTAISRLLNGLEKKGLIERTSRKGNRRVTDVEATELGKAVAEKIKLDLHDYWTEVFKNIPAEDVDNMFRILGDVLDSMEKVLKNKMMERDD